MRRQIVTVAAAVALATALGACSSSTQSSSPKAASPAAGNSSAQVVKLGLIMKFPVDFYLTMKSAAQKWAASTPGVSLSIGIGQSATDDRARSTSSSRW
jgi:ABC-type glycerol-3-phosphate transport system substrate-binding protein